MDEQQYSRRDQLDALLARIGDAVIMVDPADRTILQCNPAAERMFGYSAGELIGANTAILHVDQAAYERFGGLGESIPEKDGVFRTEFRMKRKDGTLIDTENTVTVLRAESGWQPGVLSIVRDITERKAADGALRESEDRYRLLFDHNPLPMWVYDLETLRFLAVNNAAIEHYGYSRDDFLAMTIADIRPAEDIPALRDNVARVTEGIAHAGVWRHRLEDGRIIRVRIESHTLDFEGRRAELARKIREALGFEG